MSLDLLSFPKLIICSPSFISLGWWTNSNVMKFLFTIFVTLFSALLTPLPKWERPTLYQCSKSSLGRVIANMLTYELSLLKKDLFILRQCLLTCIYIRDMHCWCLRIPWELELQRVVTYDVDPGNWIHVLLTSELTLQTYQNPFRFTVTLSKGLIDHLYLFFLRGSVFSL